MKTIPNHELEAIKKIYLNTQKALKSDDQDFDTQSALDKIDYHFEDCDVIVPSECYEDDYIKERSFDTFLQYVLASQPV